MERKPFSFEMYFLMRGLDTVSREAFHILFALQYLERSFIEEA